jgi:hypothetical protein
MLHILGRSIAGLVGATCLACAGDVDVPADVAQTGGAGGAEAQGAVTTGAGSTATGPGTGAGTGGVGAGGAPAGGAGVGGEDGGTPGVACSDAVCVAGEQCLVCDPADPASVGQCVQQFTGTCEQWGMYPPLRMACDDHQDCARGERCAVYEGSLGTYTGCWPDGDCTDGCTTCGVHIACSTLADCPACATGCEPYNAPGYPVRVCSW